MPHIDLYHRRKQIAERAGQAEVYEYDALPKPLRIQLRQIIVAAIGPFGQRGRTHSDAWEAIAMTLRREFGVDRLTDATRENPMHDVIQFIGEGGTDHVLSTIELCCRVINNLMVPMHPSDRHNVGADQEPKDALAEINTRFRQASIGYEFVDGDIVRIDSRLTHEAVIKPALSLLQDARFAGAEQEFREAHRKHRSGDNRGAVTDANSAFESTMKSICSIHGWDYLKGARASDLLKVLKAKGLFPDYLTKQFDNLQGTLTAGLPEIRNNEGGHGQGPTPRDTPDFVGAYALHLAAASIVYLCEASANFEGKGS